MNVLLVEDDARTAHFIRRGLSQAGCSVTHAASGHEGLATAAGGSFDVAVVDVMLPGIDGLALVRGLRARQVATPVILLSARSSVEDRVMGLDAGGDDYLVKPFAFSELLARIQTLVRRATSVPEPTQIAVGALSIDLIRHKASCEGRDLELQPREYALLEYLMRNAGRVVSKSMIVQQVWAYNFDPQTNVVEARICRLRDKLDSVCPHKLIHTVRGVGYVLEPRD